MIKGICHGYGDFEKIKDCGFEWHRIDCPPPFDSKTGKLSEHYIKFKEYCVHLHEQGFKVMLITPGPAWAFRQTGMDIRKEGGRAEIFEMHRFLAHDMKGIADGWQVANEVNVYFFRSPYDFDEAISYVEAGIRGIRQADSEVLLGYNFSEYDETSVYMINRLKCVNHMCDYMGLDAYHGTWIKGTPDDLISDVKKLNAHTGKPVLVQEFGFASRGEVIRDGEFDEAMQELGFKNFDDAAAHCEEYLSRISPLLAGHIKAAPRKEWESNLRHQEPHILKKWVGGSDEYPHTPQGQAKWFKEVITKLADTPCVLGFMLFSWHDAGHCFFCSDADCPCETAWGLIGNDEKEKPAYFAVKEAMSVL